MLVFEKELKIEVNGGNIVFMQIFKCKIVTVCLFVLKKLETKTNVEEKKIYIG